MRLTAITTIKNGVLRDALIKVGWSQLQLSKKASVCYSSLCNLALMKSRPSMAALNRIQAAFGEVGIFIDVNDLWPEGFKGFKKGIKLEQSKDVDDGHLLQFYENQQLLLSDSTFEADVSEVIDSFKGHLTDKQRSVVELINQGFTIQEIADRFHCSYDNIKIVLEYATRKLKHAIHYYDDPERCKMNKAIRERVAEVNKH